MKVFISYHINQESIAAKLKSSLTRSNVTIVSFVEVESKYESKKHRFVTNTREFDYYQLVNSIDYIIVIFSNDYMNDALLNGNLKSILSTIEIINRKGGKRTTWVLPIFYDEIININDFFGLNELSFLYKNGYFIKLFNAKALKLNQKKKRKENEIYRERLLLAISGLRGSVSMCISNVFLGAAAPNKVRPGEEFTARFSAYIEELEDKIKANISNVSPRSNFYGKLKKCQWDIGTKIEIRFTANHLIVTPDIEEFIWEGDYKTIEFDVIVPENAPEITTVLKFDVLISGIIIAKLRIDLPITTNSMATSMKFTTCKPIKKAFASYASKDRDRVLDRVSEIQRNGIDVFLDCLSIRPGARWKPTLKQEIEGRDSFLLFWSQHAKSSKTVTWEWKTALKCKGVDGIDLHPLDPVHDAPPPKELGSLHFGDSNMIIRDAHVKNTKKK